MWIRVFLGHEDAAPLSFLYKDVAPLGFGCVLQGLYYKDLTPTGFGFNKVPSRWGWLVGFKGFMEGKSNPVGVKA